jgi:hypothetical protein
MHTNSGKLQFVRRQITSVASPILCLLSIVCSAVPARAQQSFDMDGFFRRAFLSRAFQAKSFGPARWMNRGESYTTVEASASVPGASDLVRYDNASGKREVLLSPSELKPAGSSTPLKIENYGMATGRPKG